MIKAMDVRIVPGEIRIASVATVVDLEHVKIFELNLLSKYVGPSGYSSAEDGVTLLLLAGENTLHLDEERRGLPTFVEFAAPKDDSGFWWRIVADSARYTMRVVLYREPGFLPEGAVVSAEEITVTSRRSD